jgi:hypothetical protein
MNVAINRHSGAIAAPTRTPGETRVVEVATHYGGHEWRRDIAQENLI